VIRLDRRATCSALPDPGRLLDPAGRPVRSAQASLTGGGSAGRPRARFSPDHRVHGRGQELEGHVGSEGHAHGEADSASTIRATEIESGGHSSPEPGTVVADPARGTAWHIALGDGRLQYTRGKDGQEPSSGVSARWHIICYIVRWRLISTFCRLNRFVVFGTVQASRRRHVGAGNSQDRKVGMRGPGRQGQASRSEHGRRVVLLRPWAWGLRSVAATRPTTAARPQHGRLGRADTGGTGGTGGGWRGGRRAAGLHGARTGRGPQPEYMAPSPTLDPSGIHGAGSGRRYSTHVRGALDGGPVPPYMAPEPDAGDGGEPDAGPAIPYGAPIYMAPDPNNLRQTASRAWARIASPRVRPARAGSRCSRYSNAWATPPLLRVGADPGLRPQVPPLRLVRGRQASGRTESRGCLAVADQLADLGCEKLTLGGGEPPCTRAGTSSGSG